MSSPAPRVIVFAGPNGAGKTTHAEHILRELGIPTFVNADFIVRGLSGRHADAVAFEAGRIMLRRLQQLAAAGQDFGFEATLSSRSFGPFLRRLRALGYRVAIYFFGFAMRGWRSDACACESAWAGTMCPVTLCAAAMPEA